MREGGIFAAHCAHCSQLDDALRDGNEPGEGGEGSPLMVRVQDADQDDFATIRHPLCEVGQVSEEMSLIDPNHVVVAAVNLPEVGGANGRAGQMVVSGNAVDIVTHVQAVLDADAPELLVFVYVDSSDQFSCFPCVEKDVQSPIPSGVSEFQNEVKPPENMGPIIN